MTTDWKHLYRQGDAVMRLIWVNVCVFLVVSLAGLVLLLFNRPDGLLLRLALPASFHTLAHRPWTLLTYMFLHGRFWHLFFNMLCLFWFGKILLNYINGKQLVGLYVFGGIMGGLMYMLCYNIFPYYAPMVDASILLGASAAIMGITVAAAMHAPDMEIRLLFIGGVKLKWIACATILISLLGITGNNAGGQLSHIGGALAGYVYTILFRHGTDLNRPFTRLFDNIANLFRRTRKPQDSSRQFHYQRPTNINREHEANQQYSRHKAQRDADIDAILDKIKSSGYQSLTDEEKRRLFSN